MRQKITGYIDSLPRDLLFFVAAAGLFAFGNSVINAVFNNYLHDTFSITDFQRGILELPREMPGFLVVFVSALLFFLSPRRLASFANLLAAAGVLALAFLTTTYPVMLAWLFMYSVGQHLYLPLNSSIAMEFSSSGTMGRTLGRLNSVMNFAAIAGSFIVFAGFKYLDFTYTLSFLISAAGLAAASFLFFSMKKDRPREAKSTFVLRKEYSLFYWLNILYGTRKQIFLTFAPWVLVTVYHQPTKTVAVLLFIGGLAGILFNPLLGRMVDKMGERFVLMSEAAMLVFVCLGYGFAGSVFDATAAFYVAALCFILDQLLMSVGIARATYIKKIAVKPADVQPTLAMGVTIDHVFSIGVALVSGVIWVTVGYQYVFLIGACIAVTNLFSAARIRIPEN